jgi:hypothetical protein
VLDGVVNHRRMLVRLEPVIDAEVSLEFPAELRPPTAGSTRPKVGASLRHLDFISGAACTARPTASGLCIACSRCLLTTCSGRPASRPHAWRPGSGLGLWVTSGSALGSLLAADGLGFAPK